MDIKNIEKKENKLLNRTEAVIEIDHPGDSTPNRIELIRKIAAKLGTKEEMIAIKRVESTFDTKTFVRVNIYPSAEDLKKTEPKHIAARLEQTKKKTEEKAKKAATGQASEGSSPEDVEKQKEAPPEEEEKSE